MSSPTTFRLDELTAPLAKRAASESKTAGRRITRTDILKRALRAYLSGENAHIVDAQAIINALDKLRNDLARVGGNLNQLAHSFNIYDRVDDAELRKNHEALQAEFRRVIAAMRDIERELYKRR